MYRLTATFKPKRNLTDSTLFSLVGVSEGSGYELETGKRDHEWSFKTQRKAFKAYLQLRGLRGVKVELTGPITPRLIFGPVPDYVFWFDPSHVRRK